MELREALLKAGLVKKEDVEKVERQKQKEVEKKSYEIRKNDTLNSKKENNLTQ